MLLLGLILLAAAVVALVALLVGDNTATQTITVFNQHIHDVSGRELFVAGVITGAVGMFGLAMLMRGSRLAARRRVERRRLAADKRQVEAENARLAAQLDENEAGRHRVAEREAERPVAPAPPAQRTTVTDEPARTSTAPPPGDTRRGL
jgi:signal transduction histidine kinase